MKKIHITLVYILIFVSFGAIVYLHIKENEHCNYVLFNSNGKCFKIVSYKKIHDNCIEAYDNDQNLIIVCGQYTIKQR